MKNELANNPLVSIIMPVYNGEMFIGKAINSLLAQTFQNFELLIVNDGSTDTTDKIIDNFKRRFPDKIMVYHQKSNQGASAAINFAFRKSRGKLIALMDSDDVANAKRLEKQVGYMQNNQDILILGTQADIINSHDLIIGAKHVPQNHQEIKKSFSLTNPLIHSSCMIRKNLLRQKNKIYENKFGVNDDYYTFFKLLVFGKFSNLDEKLIRYRLHQNNSSLNKNNLKKMFFNTLKIRELAAKKHFYQFPLREILIIRVQSVMVSILPSSWLFFIYIMAKGYVFPVMIIRNFFFQIKKLLMTKTARSDEKYKKTSQNVLAG